MTVKRRIKDVPCILCEQPTRDVQSVCGRCRQLRDLGKEYEQRVKADNDPLKPFTITRYFRPESHVPEIYIRHYPDAGDFLNGILLLGHLERSLSLENRLRDVPASKAINAILQDAKRDSQRITCLMTDEQAEGIRLIMLFLHEVATYEYREGYTYGSSALMHLANGEMSTSDFDAKLNDVQHRKERS